MGCSITHIGIEQECNADVLLVLNIVARARSAAVGEGVCDQGGDVVPWEVVAACKVEDVVVFGSDGLRVEVGATIGNAED
jgi:hypothetical protein